MTIPEARVAVRTNAIVRHNRLGVSGYVYSLSWIHVKGKNSFLSVGVHDMKANSVYYMRPDELTVEKWNYPDFVVSEMIRKEEAKVQAQIEA